jgi:hypothetical protein
LKVLRDQHFQSAKPTIKIAEEQSCHTWVTPRSSYGYDTQARIEISGSGPTQGSASSKSELLGQSGCSDLGVVSREVV